MKDRLLLAVEKNIINKDQVDPLLEILNEKTREDRIHGHFDFSHLFWLVGVVLLIFSLVVFTVYISDIYNEEGLFLLSLVSLFFLYLFSRRTLNNKMLFLSSLLLVCVVIIFPFSTTLFSHLYLHLDDDMIYDVFLFSLLTISMIFIIRRRFPLLIVGVYIGLLGLFLRFSEIDIESKSFWLLMGWLTIIASWVLNLKYKLNYPFWLNKFAIFEIGYGVRSYVNTESGTIHINFLIISIILLLLAVYLRYQSFVIIGITGVLTYINYLVFDVYKDFLFASIIIGMQALLIIFLASYVYKRRSKINLILTNKMPSIFIKYRPETLKEPLSYGV